MLKAVTAAIIVLAPMAIAQGDTALCIVTWDIHHAEGTDGKLDLGRIAEILKTEHPDIVCLQEVDRGCARSGRVDMPAELARLLNMNVAFGPELKIGSGDFGNATLSRLPIVDQENIALTGSVPGEGRGCLRVRLDAGGQPLDVFNTRFNPPSSESKQAAARIIDLTRDAPAVVAGNFNEPPDGRTISVLLSRFRDSYLMPILAGVAQPKAPGGPRYDLLLVSATVNVLSSRFVDTPQSAVAAYRRPYVVRISLKRPGETAEDRGIRDNQDERIERAVVPGQP